MSNYDGTHCIPSDKIYQLLGRRMTVGRNDKTMVEATASPNQSNKTRNLVDYGTLPENAHVAEYVLLGHGAKPGQHFPHQFYPIADFHNREKEKKAASTRNFYGTRQNRSLPLWYLYTILSNVHFVFVFS
jgi:hypothetical protein